MDVQCLPGLGLIIGLWLIPFKLLYQFNYKMPHIYRSVCTVKPYTLNGIIQERGG